MGNRSTVAEKVRKLLRLSKGAGTEGEAQAAAQQAARIITKHGLSWTEVQDDEDPDDPIDVDTPTEIFSRSGRRPSLNRWEKCLGYELGQLCGCFVFWRRNRGGIALQAVGRTRDLQILAVLYPALRSTVAKLVRTETRSHRDRRIPFSPVSYGIGVVWALSSRMRSEQNAVLDEIRRGAQQALVPIDTPADRARRAREEFEARRKIRPARKSASPDFRSSARGMHDGKHLALPGQHAAITGRLALTDGESGEP